MSVLKDLQPTNVFKFFEELCQIPHGSKNEKAISDYLVNFAKERNLEVIQDKALNVIIKKAATEGYENAPTVIIQGHMDMVCEKTSDSDHDFEKDPLELRIIDGKVYATNTTLGADNGIAVAYGLALLDSKDMHHPAIEFVATTDEETGMGGAEALDTKDLKGKILLNIDSEEQGIFLVSCAGGITKKVYLPCNWEENENTTLKLEVTALKGGHSGMEIIKQRGNANKLMGRLLYVISKEVNFNIASLNGGAKHNAIPRHCETIITLNDKDVEKVKALVKEFDATFKNELRVQDKDVSAVATDMAKVEEHLTNDTTCKLISLLNLIPDGIQAMSNDIEGLVETSLNVGVISTSRESVEFVAAIRSAVRSSKYALSDKLDNLAQLVGAKVEIESEYPEWQYNPNSKIRDLCVNVYKEVTGQAAQVSAIHAGLECGLLMEKMQGTDMISFGPDLADVHTPNEHMNIESVATIWNFLKALLENIK